MARVRIMYWKEIPVQVQAEDGDGRVSVPLDERFQQAADTVSMFDGSAGNDEYLNGWEWGDYAETEGGAREAAERVAGRYNKEFPEDFADRIRGLHRSGNRDSRPGAIDGWIEG